MNNLILLFDKPKCIIYHNNDFTSCKLDYENVFLIKFYNKIIEVRMKYGYFDDDNAEYVITRPDTPTSWDTALVVAVE